MLTKNQLAEQLILQAKLNAVIDPDWLNAGYPWSRAIMVEAVEALDHYGWKWWKKQEPNLPQVRMELVDIWHFALSAFLDEGRGDIDWAAAALESRAGSSVNHDVYRSYSARDLFDRLIAAGADGWFNAGAFAKLLELTGLSWDALHHTYLAKNVLNIFRQSHGYKDGTYVKVWDGVEDNEVVAGLLAGSPECTAHELLEMLEYRYFVATE